ncbi:MAG TPA: hypothetical protein PKM88_14440, partial [bacterium]|nr:hypothetical protein [bacterium]
RLQISKRSIISRQQIAIPHVEIVAIEVQLLMPHDPITMTRYMRGLTAYAGVKLATVVHGTRKTYLAECVSEAEAQWLVGRLKSLLFTRTGRTG